MAKIKLVKNELKKQRENLQRFNRYLPMLQLKKQQLRVEIERITHKMGELTSAIDAFIREIRGWVDLFAETVDIAQWFRVDKIIVQTGNIAGVDIPVYEGVQISETAYDLRATPLWVDAGIEAIKDKIALEVQFLVLERQRKILREELRITTQRINLFEKVKLPEAKENIRVIRIFLGDLFTAEVVRGKIAKAKLQKKNQSSYVNQVGAP